MFFFLMKCTVVYEQRVNNVENCKNYFPHFFKALSLPVHKCTRVLWRVKSKPPTGGDEGHAVGRA